MSSTPNIDDLVTLSQTLGEPWRDLVILAEGNTSQRIDERKLAVKATGRSLRHAGRGDFVLVDLAQLSALIDDPGAEDRDVAALFDAIEAEQGARPSVEALLHVVCVLDGGASTVAHTHPTSVNAILCTDRASLLAESVLFPDQVVLLGRRGVLVPYTDPGLTLAREVRRRIAEHLDKGDTPRAVYLANHGMVALGGSAVQALQITEMAAKASRILAGALSVGTVVPLPADQVVRIDRRDDEQVRRAALARATLRPSVNQQEATREW